MENLLEVERIKKNIENKGNIRRFIKYNKNIWSTNDRILLNSHKVSIEKVSDYISGRFTKTISLKNISQTSLHPNIMNNLFITINNKTNKSVNELIKSIKTVINNETIDVLESANYDRSNDIETQIKFLSEIFNREYILDGDKLVIPLFAPFNNTLINFTNNEKIKIVIEFFNNHQNNNINEITNTDIEVYGFVYNFYENKLFNAFTLGYSHLIYTNHNINLGINYAQNYEGIKIRLDIINPVNLIYMWGVSIFDIDTIKFQINGHDMYFKLSNMQEICNQMSNSNKSLIETKLTQNTCINNELNNQIKADKANKVDKTDQENELSDSESSKSTLYDLVNETFNSNEIEKYAMSYLQNENIDNEPIIINLCSNLFKSLDGAIDFCQVDNAAIFIKFKKSTDLTKFNIYAILTNILEYNKSTYNWSFVNNCSEFGN